MIPVELITMAGSAILGALIKTNAISQQNKANAHKQTMEAFSKKESSIKDAREGFKNDSFAKLTRRIIVIAILGLVFWQSMAGLSGMNVAVPISVDTGFNLLGIIDTTATNIKYAVFENTVVVQEWTKHAVLAIISFYFGQGAAKT